MSAFIVDPEHIHVLLWATSRTTSPYGPLAWYYDNPTRKGELTPDTRDDVGQMLVDENAASVNYRYDEDDAYIYAYQQPQHTTWTDVEILKALDCYQYQSCEHPAWRDMPSPRLLPRPPGAPHPGTTRLRRPLGHQSPRHTRRQTTARPRTPLTPPRPAGVRAAGAGTGWCGVLRS